MSEFRKIVECELAKHGYSLEEDAYKDRKDLMLALETYDKIINLCENEINEWYKRDKINVGAKQIENINYFELKDLEPPLIVKFIVDIGAQDPRGEFDVENNIILMYLDAIYSDLYEIVEQGDEYPDAWMDSQEYLYTIKSKLCQNTFVHEFQHYLDSSRGNLVNQRKRIANRKRNKNIDYWNDPAETNAFYMQRLMNAANTLSKKYNKALRDMTSDERLEFIKNQWKNDRTFMLYYNKLNDKNKKHLLSRLYRYFSTDFWK